MHGLEGVVEDAELFDGEERRRGHRRGKSSRAKVHLPHPLIGEHRLGRALADDRAEVQHGEAARDALQRMDDVLDPDDRRALGVDRREDGEQVVAFGVGEAAGDLVEQEELRLARRPPWRVRAA